MEIASDEIAAADSAMATTPSAPSSAARRVRLHGDGNASTRKPALRSGRGAWLVITALAAVLPALLVGVARHGTDRLDATAEPAAPVDPPASSGVSLLAPPSTRVPARPRSAVAPSTADVESTSVTALAPQVEQPQASSRSATQVRVLVLDSRTGLAVPHSTVELRWIDANNEEHLVLRETDAEGRVDVETSSGTCSVVAWSGSRAGGPEVADVLPDRVTNVRIDLQPVRPVEGRVVDGHTGAPIEGAWVSFWTFAELDRVRTGPGGVFRHPRFPAASPAQQLRVEAEDYGSTVRYVEIDAAGQWYVFSPTGDDDIEADTGDPWVEVALVPQLVVRGRIVDVTRQPIAGAAVAAEGFYHILPSVASRDEARTRTAEDGSFELRGLRSDIGHGLRVCAEGYTQAKLELEAGAPSLQELGEIEMEPEHVLSGVVLAPDGRPVVDIAVMLRPARAAVNPSVAETTGLDVPVRLLGNVHEDRTSAEGTFLFPGLVPGEYRLTVARDRDVLAETTLDLVEAPNGGIVVHLPMESLTLQGEVRDDEGAAVPGAEVRLSRFGHVSSIFTDADGHFRVAGLDAEATYELMASAPCPRTGNTLTTQRSVWSYDRAVLQLQR